MQKVVSRTRQNRRFPAPGQRVPEELPREFHQEDDMPLRGPWNSPSDMREDSVEPDSSPSGQLAGDTKGERRQEKDPMLGSRPKRRGKSAHPLHSFLTGRNALAASVIWGEVINKRGGQQARSRTR